VTNIWGECFQTCGREDEEQITTLEGKHLTSGGRLILTNSSLSSMPTYMMSMYLLQEGVHQQMDTVRAKFLWGSDSGKFKYHMINV
jgi:hypothetical protein